MYSLYSLLTLPYHTLFERAICGFTWFYVIADINYNVLNYDKYYQITKIFKDNFEVMVVNKDQLPQMISSKDWFEKELKQSVPADAFLMTSKVPLF